MLRIFFRFFRSQTLRWLTAAALLLYLLIPQAGICRCMSCECGRPAQTETAETAGTVPSAAKSCCGASRRHKNSHENSHENSNENSNENGTKNAGKNAGKNADKTAEPVKTAKTETKKPERHGCPCVLKTLKVADEMILSAPVQKQKPSEIPGFFGTAGFGAAILNDAALNDAAAYDTFCNKKAYPPPLRLHLYLQVMRN